MPIFLANIYFSWECLLFLKMLIILKNAYFSWECLFFFRMLIFLECLFFFRMLISLQFGNEKLTLPSSASNLPVQASSKVHIFVSIWKDRRNRPWNICLYLQYLVSKFILLLSGLVWYKWLSKQFSMQLT